MKLAEKFRQYDNVSLMAIMSAAKECGLEPGPVILALNNLAPNES